MDLGIFEMSQLGAAGSYPWREYSADTAELQHEVNDELGKRGYATLKEDGYLGPSTCGAIKELRSEHKLDMDWPDTCESFVAPIRAPVAPALAPVAPYPPPSRFPWAPVVAVVGGLAVAGGLAWFGRRKGWF